MKSILKGFAWAYVAVGGLMVATDVIGFTLCKIMEKIGKPSEKLSTAYNKIFDYTSVSVVIGKWLIMFFAWPVTLVASWLGEFIYQHDL